MTGKRKVIKLLDLLISELGKLHRILDDNEKHLEANHAKAIRSE